MPNCMEKWMNGLTNMVEILLDVLNKRQHQSMKMNVTEKGSLSRGIIILTRQSRGVQLVGVNNNQLISRAKYLFFIPY